MYIFKHPGGVCMHLCSSRITKKRQSEMVLWHNHMGLCVCVREPHNQEILKAQLIPASNSTEKASISSPASWLLTEKQSLFFLNFHHIILIISRSVKLLFLFLLGRHGNQTKVMDLKNISFFKSDLKLKKIKTNICRATRSQLRAQQRSCDGKKIEKTKNTKETEKY